MKRRWLTTLLCAVALLLSVLLVTACDGDGDGDGGAVTTDPTTEAPAPAVTLTAAEVDAMIAAIDGATLENEDKIDEAYLAYHTLEEAERAKVTGYEALQTLRYELTKEYVVKEYRDTRIPHNEILIGGYGATASDEVALQALVDAHFDLMWSPAGCGSQEVRDLYRQYGLGMFLNGSVVVPVSTTITEEDFREATVGKVTDHEVIWLIDHRDEPGPNDMINLWRTGKIIHEELFPNSAYIQNLLPNYASGDNADPDRAYSWTYLNAVAAFTDIICFDHYLYAPENDGGLRGGNKLTCWLDDLDVLSHWCIENDKDLYAIIQNVDVWEPRTPKYDVSADMMKFQAFTAMAYGAKSLSWYYTGYYDCFVVDAEGNRTEMFDKLEETNGAVKAIEPIFMRYTAKSHVLLYDEKSPISQTMEVYQGNKDVNAMVQSSLTDIEVGKKSAVLIGAFEKNVGEGEAFMLVGCNNYRFHNNKEQLVTVTFRTADPSAAVTAYVNGIPTRLTPDENGVYTVEIIDADAVFVTVD